MLASCAIGPAHALVARIVQPRSVHVYNHQGLLLESVHFPSPLARPRSVSLLPAFGGAEQRLSSVTLLVLTADARLYWAPISKPLRVARRKKKHKKKRKKKRPPGFVARRRHELRERGPVRLDLGEPSPSGDELDLFSEPQSRLKKRKKRTTSNEPSKRARSLPTTSSASVLTITNDQHLAMDALSPDAPSTAPFLLSSSSLLLTHTHSRTWLHVQTADGYETKTLPALDGATVTSACLDADTSYLGCSDGRVFSLSPSTTDTTLLFSTSERVISILPLRSSSEHVAVGARGRLVFFSRHGTRDRSLGAPVDAALLHDTDTLLFVSGGLLYRVSLASPTLRPERLSSHSTLLSLAGLFPGHVCLVSSRGEVHMAELASLPAREPLVSHNALPLEAQSLLSHMPTCSTIPRHQLLARLYLEALGRLGEEHGRLSRLLDAEAETLESVAHATALVRHINAGCLRAHCIDSRVVLFHKPGCPLREPAILPSACTLLTTLASPGCTTSTTFPIDADMTLDPGSHVDWLLPSSTPSGKGTIHLVVLGAASIPISEFTLLHPHNTTLAWFASGLSAAPAPPPAPVLDQHIITLQRRDDVPTRFYTSQLHELMRRVDPQVRVQPRGDSSIVISGPAQPSIRLAVLECLLKDCAACLGSAHRPPVALVHERSVARAPLNASTLSRWAQVRAFPAYQMYS